MQLLKEIKFLIHKELILEWRSRYAINGILLYVFATVFVCYLSFKKADPIAWNALFWIILLFASVNAVAKSFIQESRGRHLYYYQVASPQGIILSKIFYNMLIMSVLSLICLVFYRLVFFNELHDPLFYILGVLLGSISFSTVFTMISAIASKTNNSATLMTILSFPVIVPLLMLLIRFSKNAMDGLDRSVSMDELLVILAINVIVIITSLLLFPYIWRD